ncbi:hypothetical protein AAFF_G00239000 [Aldrovandia affinis]|uniref:Ubinuclein middle domain-containing protein n=1 Tax=Aldrovandia affinis TaxID=143900 RepID=A0AAD7W4F6_9TELE|nr:hypothetical protein AAFF_G00239000 [Aldrovandia affinis]
MADLTADPAVMSLLGSTSESELQDLLGDLDFNLLDSSPQSCSPAQRENGMLGVAGLTGPKAGAGALGRGSGAMGTSAGLLSPPPLPDGLPPPLTKRIEDLRAASRQFDQEGRKKFFTLDMNNILLDIELQVQEQPPPVRSAVYCHLEAFVPCNKEALLKRLKKLSLNIQDDRLRTPLLKLKLAVCSVMPEQIARYNIDCMAKAAKQQSEEGEKNGSEEEDEEKPGKRVMGPRKKFVWDDRLRTLLCNLVRVKLGCYELESQCSLSVEDYLKAFMENEVKPLWPKGWMQARMLFKESRSVHSHLTGNLAKRKIVPTQKARAKEGVWVQRPAPSVLATPSPALLARRPSSPSETICLSDSLDDDLTAPSLDSISHALALLSSVAKGLVQSDSPPSPPGPHAPKVFSSTPVAMPTMPHYVSSLPHPHLAKKEASAVSAASVSTPSTSPSSSSSPSSSARSEGFGMMKGEVLLFPGVKPMGGAPTSGLLKSSNKVNSGNGGSLSNSIAMPPQSRAGSIKSVQSYTLAGAQKSSPHSGTNTTPTSTSAMTSRPVSSPSPSSSSASHGQRQRSVGGANQGAKPVVSRAPVASVHSQLSQVSSAGGNLLGPTPSLPLGFGMLGGLVPVSLPFQFPSLLNFTPPGAPGGSGMGAAASNNSGYSLAQNLLKSLQSGSQAGLPPHLQLAFSDANQSQGGDMKRKSH